MLFKRVTPNEGFIGLCIGMPGVDGFIDPRAWDFLFEILVRNGFDENEIDKVFNDMGKLNPKNDRLV
ncbi:MAG: hypothetical protein H8E26_00175 [FCB group bacterium]|nr:hypothetical protein [FCB group bacterium]